MRLCYKKYFLLWTTFIFFSASATQLKLELTNNGQGSAGGNTVTAHTPFEVTVTVSEGDRNTGSVTLDGADQVKIVGTSRSTNISMINGQFSSQTSYIYQLYALKEGDLKLGPAQVKQNNQTISSNTLDLKVLKAPEQPQQPQQQGTSTQASNNNQAADQTTAVLCRLTANKKTALVGETIIAKVSILSRGPILQVGMEQPKFPGFMVKETPNTARRQETFNNVLYNVLEKKYLLTPTEPGTKTIEPVQIAYAVPVKQRPRHRGLFDDAFFSGFFDQERIEQKNAASNALQLTITTLPENQGQIDGVGEFTSFTAHLNKKEAHVNEALTLRLELTGEGNFNQIATPKLTLPPFMKAYDSKTSVKEDAATEGLSGKKTFEYVIQIAQEGDAEIPAQQFTYFDTATHATKTIKSSPVMVHLTPAPQTQQSKVLHVKEPEETPEESSASPQKKPTKTKQDISFIQEDGPINSRAGSGIGFIMFLLLMLLIPGAIFSNQAIVRVKTKLSPNLFKQHTHQKQLDHLQKEFAILQQKSHIDQLYQFFIKILAARCNVDVEAITHEQLQAYLANQNWEEQRINDFFDFLNECASYRFVSNTTRSKINLDELFKKSSHWLLLLSK